MKIGLMFSNMRGSTKKLLTFAETSAWTVFRLAFLTVNTMYPT